MTYPKETYDISPGNLLDISRKPMKYLQETYEISQRNLSKYIKETYQIISKTPMKLSPGHR